MHDILVQVPFALGSQQDPHKPSWVLADLGASGLGLPDRDYYLKPEPRFKEAREKYVEHVTAMFKLAGWDQKSAAAAAQTIMGMETKLAEASLDNVALRDPAATDHNTTFAQLQALAPHVRLGRLLQTQADPHRRRHERRPAQVHAGSRPPDAADAARRLENLFEVATARFRRQFAFGALRRRKFRLQRKISCRHHRDEAALEALRRIHRSIIRRSARQEICREIFPARGQGPHAGDGAQSSPRHARRHPQPPLDERRHQRKGDGQDRHLQSQDRISRQVEGLQPRRNSPRRILRRHDRRKKVRRTGRPRTDRQDRRSRPLGHDAAHLRRVLQPAAQRNRLPRRNSAATRLRHERSRRGELRRHRRGDRPRNLARLRR